MMNLKLPLVSRKRLEKAWESNARLMTEVSNQKRRGDQFEAAYLAALDTIRELTDSREVQ